MSTGKPQPPLQGAAERARDWFAGRVPPGWFDGEPEVVVDREEITVIGRLPEPGAAEPDAAGGQSGGEAPGDAGAQAESALGRARRFREETREARIDLAREAEGAFGRKVSWGVTAADRKVMFTTFSVPVMTRLRQSERQVLDTLVDAGVARSRSDALAWCVRLVGQHEDTWLADLRQALSRVEQVRRDGPRA